MLKIIRSVQMEANLNSGFEVMIQQEQWIQESINQFLNQFLFGKQSTNWPFASIII